MEKLDWVSKLVKFGLTVKQLTPWQYRVSCKEASMRVDLYPTNKKFHDIETGERGVYHDEYLFSCASFYRKVKDLNDARVKSNQIERKGGDGVGASRPSLVICDDFEIKGGDGTIHPLPNLKGNKVAPFFISALSSEDSADVAAFKSRDQKANVRAKSPRIDFKVNEGAELRELGDSGGLMMESKANVGGLKLKFLIRTHFLKIDKQWLERVRSGEKNCEIRFNDRDFQAGDRIQYIEPKSERGGDTKLISHPLIKITHVLHAAQFPEGLKDGYCILSLKLW